MCRVQRPRIQIENRLSYLCSLDRWTEDKSFSIKTRAGKERWKCHARFLFTIADYFVFSLSYQILTFVTFINPSSDLLLHCLLKKTPIAHLTRQFFVISRQMIETARFFSLLFVRIWSNVFLPDIITTVREREEKQVWIKMMYGVCVWLLFDKICFLFLHFLLLLFMEVMTHLIVLFLPTYEFFFSMTKMVLRKMN